MNKGIVMELAADYLIVMTPDGSFRKIPRDRRSCDVGEEIVFADGPRSAARRWFRLPSYAAAAIVACLVIAAGIFGSFGTGRVVAYVSMDINPSVELGINSHRMVLELKALNADGFRLIDQLDYKGKPLQDVTLSLLDQAEQQGYLSGGEGEIVIAGTLVADKAAWDDSALVNEVKSRVQERIAQVHPRQADAFQVTALVTPPELREAAESEGLSAGKYAIYLDAKSNGLAIPLEQFKERSIREIARQNGGLDQLIPLNKAITKKDLKQLLEEEKKGLLDKHSTQLAEDANAGNGNAGKGPGNGSDAKQNLNSGAGGNGANNGKNTGTNSNNESGKDGKHNGKDNSKPAPGTGKKPGLPLTDPASGPAVTGKSDEGPKPKEPPPLALPPKAAVPAGGDEDGHKPSDRPGDNRPGNGQGKSNAKSSQDSQDAKSSGGDSREEDWRKLNDDPGNTPPSRPPEGEDRGNREKPDDHRGDSPGSAKGHTNGNGRASGGKDTGNPAPGQGHGQNREQEGGKDPES